MDLKAGTTNVFDDVADTEVDALVECSRNLTEERSVQEVGNNLHRLKRLVLNCGSYLQASASVRQTMLRNNIMN
jgi:hypothetical protein